MPVDPDAGEPQGPVGRLKVVILAVVVFWTVLALVACWVTDRILDLDEEDVRRLER